MHRPEGVSYRDHGIIICPPLGYEQIHSHRTLRHLADTLAAARFAAVRFDFHGTGDSSGWDEDPDRVTVWLANFRDAHHWLRQQLGCRRISTIGLRLGAMLAAQAALEQPLDSLLLWAPVVKGRSYVRETKALSLTSSGNLPRSAATTGEIESAGFVLTEQTVRDLSCLDLLQGRPLCRRALILSRDDTPQDTHLLEHYKAHGIETTQVAVPGYADMMAEPHFCKVPSTAINTIVDWLSTNSLDSDQSEEGCSAVDSLLPGTEMPGMPSSGYSAPSPQRLRERVLSISSQPHLFGILTEPLQPPRKELPIIVLINAGSCYRAGPNRLYVFLARLLAGQGFRCLRMDLCGLGDSICPDSSRENDPYPATAFRDIDITLEYLTGHLGVERAVLMGLCSGAYAAFQSAVQMPNPALVESVLINPLTFYWREGMSLESTPASQLKSFQDSMASARQVEKWLKLLSGRSKLGIKGALRMLVQRFRLRRQRVTEGERNTAGPSTHPLHEDLTGDLQRVAKAGRHLACFFSRSDPGYGLLTLDAGRKVHEMRRDGRMSVYFIEDADHTFSRRAARCALGQALTQHFVQRYPVR